MRANLTRARALAAGTAFALAPRALRAQTLEKLRMSAVPTDDMTPIYWAIKTGLYRRAGIDLEIVPVSSGSASTAAVVGGAYEMGKASPAASVIAHLRGIPLVIVANGSLFTPGSTWNGLLVAADAPLRVAADFNGKTGAAAALNDISTLAFSTWMEKNGGDAASVKWVEVPGTAAGATVEARRVDFAVLNEPQLSAALANGKLRMVAVVYGALAERWLTSAYLALPEFAGKHAEMIARFARVTYESAAYTNAHPAETIEMMSEASKIPPAVFGKMARIQGATSGDPGLLQPVIDIAVRFKLIARSFPPKELYWTG